MTPDIVSEAQGSTREPASRHFNIGGSMDMVLWIAGDGA
jgi:hypothetical protein